MKLKYKLNFARRESTKHIKKIGAVLGSAALAGVLTMTGLFREYVSMRPLFSISINETEDKNLNREIDIFNTGGAVENLKLSDATVHMVVTIRNDTKAKSYGKLNRTETRALSVDIRSAFSIMSKNSSLFTNVCLMHKPF